MADRKKCVQVLRRGAKVHQIERVADNAARERVKAMALALLDHSDLIGDGRVDCLLSACFDGVGRSPARIPSDCFRPRFVVGAGSEEGAAAPHWTRACCQRRQWTDAAALRQPRWQADLRIRGCLRDGLAGGQVRRELRQRAQPQQGLLRKGELPVQP